MLYIHSILVPTDFSESAKHALHVARSLARDHRASLILLHAAHPMPYMAAEINLPPADFDGMATKAQQRLELLGQSIADLPAETRIVFAEPGPAIVTTAKDDHVDLVVMATHGRTGVSRLLLGSVAEYVLRHAPCPVLTIKPGTDESLTEEAAELAVEAPAPVRSPATVDSSCDFQAASGGQKSQFVSAVGSVL